MKAFSITPNTKQKLYSSSRQGYAIIGVLIMMVVGVSVVIIAQKENTLLTKISGFFVRKHTAQSMAESGLDLARLDLKRITKNVRYNKIEQDMFTRLREGGQQSALDQGLHSFMAKAADRIIQPRFTRNDGARTLSVLYFPQNPCQPDCSTEDDYNTRFPKIFNIVSQVQDKNTGEVFTVESKVLVRLESFTEIAYGITGIGDYPVLRDGETLAFKPSVYGRTHFNINQNLIQLLDGGDLFIKGNIAYPESLEPVFFGDNNTHLFLGPLTFEQPELHDVTIQGQDMKLPFKVENRKYSNYNDIEFHPNVELTKNYGVGVDVITEPDDLDYDLNIDPMSDLSFQKYQSIADSGNGLNFSDSQLCVYNPVVRKVESNICLKMDGDQLLRYECENAYADRPGEFFMPPSIDIVTPSVDIRANRNPNFNTELLEKIKHFPDRYSGEREDVRTGVSSNAIESYPLDGLVFCKNAGCECNIHIKGIYDGSVNFVADNIVIEGDIVNKDQENMNHSTSVFGAIAKNNIIIPEGVPQAANSSKGPAWNEPIGRIDLTAASPPFDRCSPSSTGCNNPASLAESYLNITNFIADDGVSYVDRDADDASGRYRSATPWFDYLESYEPKKYFNSPMALDLEGHFLAGEHVVVNGIFNPELTTDSADKQGIAILTCEQYSGDSCKDYSYREPVFDGDVDEDGLAYQYPLYDKDSDGKVIFAQGSAGAVQPIFYIDGLRNGKILAGNINTSADYYDFEIDNNEATPRMKNELIYVYGSLNSKYFFSSANNNAYEIGFRNKIMVNDPRAGNVDPPGFPQTNNIIYNELFRKSYLGRSTLFTKKDGAPLPDVSVPATPISSF